MNLIFKKFHLENIHSFDQALKLKGEKILVYFPHGLGDWVMFNHITQFLDDSNELFMTRFGDDYVSIQEGSIVKPAYCGINTIEVGHGNTFNKPHFNFRNGLELTGSLKLLCEKHKIKYFYHEPFFEGRSQWPYHSKPRNVIRNSQGEIGEDKKKLLNFPLSNSLSTKDDPFVSNFVLSRLSSYTNFSFDSKLVLMGRTGITSVGKNWGYLSRNERYNKEGAEAIEFVDLCLQKNKNTFFIYLESHFIPVKDSFSDYSRNSFSYHELFGDMGGHKVLPFAMVLKSLCNLSSAFVGVPSGPMAVASVYENLFAANIWLDHLPSWYHEPKKNEVNLISNNNIQSRRASNSLDEREGVKYNNHYIDNINISGQTVFDFTEGVLC